MSTFTDTIRVISDLHRRVNDQRELLIGFQKAHREEINEVRRELHGTTGGYDRRIVDGLGSLDQQIKVALRLLDSADASLRRVERI